ncbi:MAG: hypothetical protein RR710_09230 [Oscillospiraceae bacterium]
MKKEIKNHPDLYIFVSCTQLYTDAVIHEKPYNALMARYLSALNDKAEYECSNEVYKQLDRTFLGEYDFACMDDTYENIDKNGELISDKLCASKEAYLVLTRHQSTGLSILTIIIPQNSYDVTAIQDQVSTDHIYLSDIGENKFERLSTVLQEKYGLKKIGNSKCLVCLKNKPQSEQELCAMLASESYNSTQMDYKIKSNQFLTMCNTNIAQYDFYEAYASSSTVVYIVDKISKVFKDNLEYEIAMVFICELILFQNAAIARANDRIIKSLTSEVRISLKYIEELHVEFGKTIVFWNVNNFKYELPQILSDLIAESFQTPKLLEGYRRNQEHLEHLIDLRNSQSSEREGKVINAIAILLAVIQVIPLLIDAVHFTINSGVNLVYPVSFSAMGFLVVLILFILARKRKAKKSKHRL